MVARRLACGRVSLAGGLVFFLAALWAVPAAAQQGPPAPEEAPVGFRAQLMQEPGARLIRTEGRVNLPDGAVIHLAVVYVEDGQVGVWHKTKVVDGRYAFDIPLEDYRLFPGEYEVEARFLFNRQPFPVRDEFSQGRRIRPDFEQAVGWMRLTVGTPEDRELGLEEALEKFLVQARRLEELAAEGPRLYSDTAGSGSGLLAAQAVDAFKQRMVLQRRAVNNLRQELADWEAEYLHLPFADWMEQIGSLCREVVEYGETCEYSLDLRLQLQKGADAALQGEQDNADWKREKLEILIPQDTVNLTGLFQARLEGLRAVRRDRQASAGSGQAGSSDEGR